MSEAGFATRTGPQVVRASRQGLQEAEAGRLRRISRGAGPATAVRTSSLHSQTSIGSIGGHARCSYVTNGKHFALDKKMDERDS